MVEVGASRVMGIAHYLTLHNCKVRRGTENAKVWGCQTIDKLVR